MNLRTLLWTALVLPACGFTAPASGDDPTYPGGSPPGSTTPPDPTGRHCTTSDPTLQLCIDFDDGTTLTGDGSGRHHDAVSTDISVTPRKSEMAALVTEDSRVTVAETPDLDITGNLTVSLWARPDHLPDEDKSFWAVDNNRQYYISYQDNGKFRCGIGTTTVDASVGVTPGDWYHVACTFSEQQHQLRVFVGGQLAGCRTVSGTIPTTGAEGLAIGSNVDAGPEFSDPFIGGLDNVQVFARTFSTQDVCDASGAGGCFQVCPAF